jgi:pantetheine-phosphate adenylyltransferase
MIALYPGSFDPVTRGHLDVIRRALGFCPQLIIAVGSNLSKQNLFTVTERIEMIYGALNESFSPAELARITVTEFTGAVVYYAQQIGATLIVKGIRTQFDYAHEEKMSIVNRRLSDETDTVFLMADNNLRDVSSSAVREMARIGIAPEKFDHYLTTSVRDALLARTK